MYTCICAHTSTRIYMYIHRVMYGLHTSTHKRCCHLQPGAVKLVICGQWMHLSFMHPVTPESQVHCPSQAYNLSSLPQSSDSLEATAAGKCANLLFECLCCMLKDDKMNQKLFRSANGMLIARQLASLPSQVSFSLGVGLLERLVLSSGSREELKTLMGELITCVHM